MRALWIASMLPTRFNWLGGPWNLRSMMALRDHQGIECRAMCPIGLTPPVDFVRQLPRNPGLIREWLSLRLADRATSTKGGIPISYHRWLWPPKRLFWSREGRFLRAQIRSAFARTVAEFQPDVLHAPWLHPEGTAAALLGREYGIPVIAQGIGNDANYYLHEYGGRGRVISDLRQATILLFNCESTRRMAAAAGLEHPRTRIVYHGVEVDKFTLRPRGGARGIRRIITVAQLIPRKNHQLLLRAFARLPETVRDRAVLEFVGRGPLRQELEALARELGLSEKVVFAGSPNHDDMIARLQQADIFCLPTLSEGMPVATIEAMSCGLPVVASRVDGIPESVQDGVNGLLVPPGDAAALAQALAAALARDWDRQAIREAVLQKFTWTLYAQGIRSVYEEARAAR